MTTIERIKEILIGIVMISMSLYMLHEPRRGFRIIILVFSVTLLLTGIRSILYYIDMGRHMVDGRTALYKGVILADLSSLGLMLNNFSTLYIVLYLVSIHAFSGGVDVFGAVQAKKLDTPWRGKLIEGLVNLAVAGFCVYYGFVIKDKDSVVYIYAAGLLYSAVSRIIAAFRKTAIVYIQ
jgi:uncharacterized membrane protein HdeD (DUF308 family)